MEEVLLHKQCRYECGRIDCARKNADLLPERQVAGLDDWHVPENVPSDEEKSNNDRAKYEPSVGHAVEVVQGWPGIQRCLHRRQVEDAPLGALCNQWPSKTTNAKLP